jgi:hypothetical protein
MKRIQVSFDVDVEHPVVSPAALTGLAHGIDRRFAGSVAVGVRMKYWLQNRLQVTTDDLLDVEPAPYREGFICSPTRMD